MSAKVFYTNIFSCISSLSNGAIQNASTNIDTTVAAAYSKFIHSPEEFDSVNLINNFYLKKGKQKNKKTKKQRNNKMIVR